MNKIYLHPLMILGIVWGSVYFLYDLHWSELQIYPVEGAHLFLLILFAVFICISLLFYAANINSRDALKVSNCNIINLDVNLQERVKHWGLIWFSVTIVEIVFSGGVPLFWLFTGSSKTYFDFGLPTIHGLANGLISSVSLVSFFIYMKHGAKKFLLLSLFILLWGVIAVSRQIVIVNLIQYVIVYFSFKPPKPFGLIKFLLFGVIFVLSFGWLGDIRTGADKFIGLAMPTDAYPEFLPSGVLWVYMYAVTPIMNLINTINISCGCDSIFLSNTISPLFPSILRGFIIDTSIIEKGEVVSQAFNVSTAFSDPYSDLGYIGIFVFTAFIAAVTIFYWRKTDTKGFLIYAVLAQSLILSIFYNHFFSLPVISQVFWLWVFFRGRKSPA